MPKWNLRFDVAQCEDLASRFAAENDIEVIKIGQSARERGGYSYEEFLSVCLWKTPRSKSRCRKNSPSDVEEITKVALSVKNERLRIESLRSLHGVEWPTASVLLHFAHNDPYPILDVRALWSLGFDKPSVDYRFEFWWQYVEACRQLSNQTGLSMRQVDRALWQYSKEHQASLTNG